MQSYFITLSSNGEVPQDAPGGDLLAYGIYIHS